MWEKWEMKEMKIYVYPNSEDFNTLKLKLSPFKEHWN